MSKGLRTPYPSQQKPRRSSRRTAKLYDAIVVGGGPAGLSAAIYLARYNRSVLVVDAGEGRSTAHQTNENYLGFPRGIRSRDLRKRGLAQAVRFGAQCVDGHVTSVRRDDDQNFVVRCGGRRFTSRALVLATGVVDSFPDIEDIEAYVGVSLFWCITCDGWKTRGKRVLVVGSTDEAATTSLQFLNFTDRVMLITNSHRTKISATKLRALEASGIELIRARIASVEGRAGNMRAVQASNGERVAVDLMFSSQGCVPNSELARTLRLKLEAGYIKADSEQRTSVKLVYAAGDVTKDLAHQIVTAAHEGATAGQAANYDLYLPHQRE